MDRFVDLTSQPLYLQFAGQAVEYLKELKELATNPACCDLIQEACKELKLFGENEEFGAELSQGLDVATWLVENSSSSPDSEYLSKAPISYPLITLTQLAQAQVVAVELGHTSPTDLPFTEGFGHSSGVVSAAVVALAKSADEFCKLAVQTVLMMAYHGLRCQQHCPELRLSKDVKRSDYPHSKPTPMLRVEHMGIPNRVARLEAKLAEFNKHVSNSKQLSVGLNNGSASIVVGAPESLHWLCEELSKSPNESRIPHAERTPPLTPQFLEASVPFHSPKLMGVDADILDDIHNDSKLKMLSDCNKAPLRFCVRSTESGEELTKFDIASLIRMQTSAVLDWSVTTKILSEKPGIVLDMGPSVAAARMTLWLHEGNGAVVVSPVVRASNTQRGLLTLAALRKNVKCLSWIQRFAPRLDAQNNLVTKFTKLVGRPPIMVPGMTPWSHAGQVAAVAKAGYHAELAGGGIPLPHRFEKEIRDLAVQMPPGAGITVNLLYLNAYLWGFQFPMIEKLAKQGEPVESVTVAAGVPSLEKLRDIVATAKRARLNFITFKPGSSSAIHSVLEVCKHFPEFQFVIQWTGGRSGGHHSFEDQFEPLLETYALIRELDNMTLVVGGGLGDDADAFEWMSGQWSLRFGRPAMPVDAILMGSRVLVTAESATGDHSKDLILAAKGVADDSWQVSMKAGGDAGGVITVNSELGEPIHVVKNRCSELWREFDAKYFHLSQDQMVEALNRDKAWVIEQLNAHFQKPWFGKSKGLPCDIGEMTYFEVCVRLMELMFIPSRKEWIDVSYRVRLQEMLVRTQERFAATDEVVTDLLDISELDSEPADLIERVFNTYPAGRSEVLLIEDRDYFIYSVCNRPDRKPTNFIPQIDKMFKRYFKSDSLWFSETLHAVQDGDAGRTFIIYGPVAAQHVRTKNETLAELLDGVCNGLKKRVADAKLAGTDSSGEEDSLQTLAKRNGVQVVVNPSGVPSVILSFGKSCGQHAFRTLLTSTDAVKSCANGALLSGTEIPWIAALFHGLVVRGDRRATSPVSKLLAPKEGMRVIVAEDGNRLLIARGENEPNVSMSFSPESSKVTVSLTHQFTARGKVPLELEYKLEPSTPSCPLHEPCSMRYSSSTKFYVNIWNAISLASESEDSSFEEPEETAPLRPVMKVGSQVSVAGLASQGQQSKPHSHIFSRADVLNFCQAVGFRFQEFMHSEHPRLPSDMAIVAGWSALISAVTEDARVGHVDWLSLLHLENRFEELGVRHLQGEADVLTSQFEVIEVSSTGNGKRIGARGCVKHCGQPWVMVTTYFFVPTDVVSREESEEDGVSFEVISKRFMIPCDTEKLELLKSKDFFIMETEVNDACDIVVEVHSHESRCRKGSLNIQAHGTVSQYRMGELVPVGTVDYCPRGVEGNALLAFLERHAKEYPHYQELDAPYLMLEVPDVVRTPVNMKRYSKVSGDWNPIHTDDTFAQFASLDGPIVHGMWLSANAKRVLLENLCQEGQTVTKFQTQFVDKVPLGSRVVTQVKHTGMRGGKLVVEVECRKLEDGQVCLRGDAEIRQRKSLLGFTGQGSQFAGMGKELRQSSETVAALWGRADQHFLSKYGISLLRILDENPQEVTVHFGGADGPRIRDVYCKLMRRAPSGDKVRVFPSITPTTMSYTFSHKSGLLNATQFTQPLIVMCEWAQFLELKNKEVIPSNCMFAGHSLGEYAALTAIAEVLPMESLLDIVFMRGLTMQAAIDRKVDGTSDYAMVAVNPVRVSKKFTSMMLQQTVELIDSPDELLQIVNYNVEPIQYVCAGHVRALTVLRLVLDEVAATGCDVNSAVEKHKISAKFTSIAALKGKATIPIPGIDVPFHSRNLRGGVDAFREVLESYFPQNLHGVAVLEGRYIPNLVAVPFELTKAFVELAQQRSDSPILAAILQNWESASSDTKALARTILIELLAYQFASPVLWLQTVEQALCKFGVKRFVEFGPGPVLKGMMKNALMVTPALVGQGSIENLHFSDSTDLTFTFSDRGASTEDHIKAEQAAAAPLEEIESVEAAAPVPVIQTVALPTTARVAASSGPEVDCPIRALDALKVIVASRVGEIAPGKTLKQLVGGRSALQNEIIGELSAEFGSDPPENGSEMPLDELANSWPGYSKMGKATTQLVSKVLLQTQPAGSSMKSVHKQLEEEFAVTPATVDGILLRAVQLAPKKRLSAAESVAWRASLVSAFNSEVGVSAGPRGAGPATAGTVANTSAAMDPATAEKLKAFAKTIAKAANDFLGPQPEKDVPELPAPSPLEAEFGEKFADGVQAMFAKEQVREYNDWWSVGQRRIYRYWQETEHGLLDLDSEQGKFALRMASVASSKDALPLLSWLDSQSMGQGAKFCTELKSCVGKGARFFEGSGTLQPTVQVDASGKIVYKDVPRQANYAEYVAELDSKQFVHMRTRAEKRPEHLQGSGRMVDDSSASSIYIAALQDLAEKGATFEGKVALLTGVSSGSILEPLVKALLQGGATVIMTKRWMPGGEAPYEYARKLYEQNCGQGARLIIVPFNKGSVRDVEALVKHIYSPQKAGGLGLDVDYFFPFAALPEKGRGIDRIDDIAELAHRVMLTNTIRMVGAIFSKKKEQKLVGRTTLCVMPLSPNHGVFGSDGLYAESKLGLESFFEKWHSEGLKDYLSIVGAEIGWVRGTNLMIANNMVAPAMEDHGCHTFTAPEMAFNLIGLLQPQMMQLVQQTPIHAVLTGKMEAIEDLAGLASSTRAQLNKLADVNKLIFSDSELDRKVEGAGSVTSALQAAEAKTIQPRPYLGHSAATVPTQDRRGALSHLCGMVDPASTVVITGFGEVGPWGDSKTRWEMERDGEFSIEGCVLMAWMLGYIKYFNGPQPVPKGPPVHYSGWVDSVTGKPMSYWDVKATYESKILSNCGLRILDPEVLHGFDGSNQMMHHTVMLEQDLPSIDVEDAETAQGFARQHGEFCKVSESANGAVSLQLLKGAKIYVPRALRTDRWVCAQVPSGWDPKRYGIPEEIVAQCDRVTLYAIVSCAEALQKSGIIDPYEFYEYVHLSQVGNTIGSGIGGMHSLKEIFNLRYRTDSSRVKGDALQETFVNTTAAWVNMLLISSSGPIKTPVGACATAMESAAIAVDVIRAGQAKVCLVGGTDELSDVSIQEFASMKATASADADKIAGRQPHEISRPMSATRSGFAESHGAGVMVFMSGDLALAMGAPIRAVVAHVHTATDGVGRSVPAPGQGVLTAVSESGPASPLLDVATRRKLLEQELKSLRAAAGALPADELARLESLARRRWSLDWWQNNPSVSPFRGALSVFGLTGDDITVASCHGTSTKKNDLNEPSILQQEMIALGRTPGNPLHIVTQKYLTGHPKGAAAAWQMNGIMQAMEESVIPGNRNLDCVDPELRKFNHLFFTNTTIHRQYIKAALINSFGFGQAGGQCLLIHPDYFLASVDDGAFSDYVSCLQARSIQSFKHRQDVLGNRVPYVPIKGADETPHSVPFAQAAMMKDLRRPKTLKVIKEVHGARTSVDGRNAEAVEWALVDALKERCTVADTKSCRAIGIDAEPIRSFDATFLERNFRSSERQDIQKHDEATNTWRTATGHWAIKEAVVKALGNAGAQLGASHESLIDIELDRSENGAVTVKLQGKAHAAAQSVGASEVQVSLTYAQGVAYAAAILQ
jgi:fatty acid synthase subunit beta